MVFPLLEFNDLLLITGFVIRCDRTLSSIPQSYRSVINLQSTHPIVCDREMMSSVLWSLVLPLL